MFIICSYFTSIFIYIDSWWIHYLPLIRKSQNTHSNMWVFLREDSVLSITPFLQTSTQWFVNDIPQISLESQKNAYLSNSLSAQIRIFILFNLFYMIFCTFYVSLCKFTMFPINIIYKSETSVFVFVLYMLIYK